MFRAARWRIRLWSATSSIHERDVRHRALDEGGAGRDGLGLAREQVVEDRHVGARVDEPARDSRPDETGAAGDEDPACAEGSLEGLAHHRRTPVRSISAGRKSRHQSLMPRILVYGMSW